MKILIIDDDPGMTDLLSVLLAPSGADTLVANTASDGLELARSGQPDIIILDLLLPEMNGVEICKKIREFSSVPILVVSALDSPKVIAQVLDSGADGFLSKPISSAILTAQINKLLRRSSLVKKSLTKPGLSL